MMSLSCVEELLRTVSDRFTDFLVRVDRFERSLHLEGKVGRYIFTLALIDYLLDHCTAFRATTLNEIYFNCGGRYLYIHIGFWSQSETLEIQRNRLANGLFEWYLQTTGKLPKEVGRTNEEEELLKHLSKFVTFAIYTTAFVASEVLYNIIEIAYTAPPMGTSIDNYILGDPSILIHPDATRPEVDEITFETDIASRQTKQEVFYQVFFYPSSRRIEEKVLGDGEEYAKAGRQGACLVKDKLLDEFSRLMNLLNGAFSLALTYLLY